MTSERSPGDGTPRQTMVALGPRISAAFGAADVRIDALCLTAELLSAALGEQRTLIHTRRSMPATITVRVLLPNRDIDLAFPRMISAPEEPDPVHRRWLAQRNAHGIVLSDHLRGLGAVHGIDVDIQFKALPFTPPVKLYLLNGTEALFAYYQVTEREEQIGRESVAMYDALGGGRVAALLVRRGRRPRPRVRDAVADLVRRTLDNHRDRPRALLTVGRCVDAP
ncbi:hypothetical protein [Streptomyces sp. NPDC059943]|uniref:hypothetical protein n=1 Tax=Streptomyces sp. NPDC059943 TaxID=3347010 RepID=UPI003646BE83